MRDFATLVGKLSSGEMRALAALARTARWRERQQPDRLYYTAEVPRAEFWEKCDRAFFLLLPGGGVIHRHTDVAIKGITHHFVLATNDGCVNYWLDDQGRERQVHMEAGHRYDVLRAPVHWSRNDGDTDRIHLLVEYEA